MFYASVNSTLPQSPSTVRDAILKLYEVKKLQVISELNILKARGCKFSLSLDEWTSMSNRRFMNVTVHAHGGWWNLGLHRITGSFTAEACLMMLTEKLGEFEILMSDVVGITTDGASVMKKFGRITHKKHQLCLAHGIHLAVTDVLYKKPIRINIEDGQARQNVENENSQLNEFDENENVELLPGSDDPMQLDEEGFESTFEQDEGEEIAYDDNIADVITAVRKIVIGFRNSAKKTEMLKKNGNTDRGLILDSRTRWNSLFFMLQRFYEMKDAVQKTLLIDLKEQMSVSEQDYELLKSLIETLEPVKLASEAICTRDTTLADADVAVKFALDQLSNCTSTLAQEMKLALQKRIQERRTRIFDVAAYFRYASDQAPDQNDEEEGYFQQSSRQEIAVEIKAIFEQFSNFIAEENDDINNDDTQASESMIEISMREKLMLALNTSRTYKPKLTGKNSRFSLSVVKREMQGYEANGKMGKTLDFVNQILLTIPPTSVESERVFSASNNFCSKLRSKLADRTLNALVFLKTYLK